MNMECSDCGRPFSSKLNHHKQCPRHIPGLPVPVCTRVVGKNGRMYKFWTTHPESRELRRFAAVYGSREN